MKTIQISDELWKRLKLESVHRGVTMREVVESVGAAWEASLPQTVIERAVQVTALRGAVEALKSVKARPIPSPGTPGYEIRDEVSRAFVRELKVELEE